MKVRGPRLVEEAMVHQGLYCQRRRRRRRREEREGGEE